MSAKKKEEYEPGEELVPEYPDVPEDDTPEPEGDPHEGTDDK